jgi:spore maturation protein CgeB
MRERLSIVVLGLSITSSWGNGHAVTYRGLVRELTRRGHDVTFLERDVPWYAENRDLPAPAYGRTCLYQSLEELADVHGEVIRRANAVIVGSFIPDGIAVGQWVVRVANGVTGFYDIDTPVTLAQLARGACAYLDPALVRRYDVYLSFTGGATLRHLERRLGARMARALYCSVDPERYFPASDVPLRWDLAYMGTYSSDRQPALEELLLAPARSSPDGRFAIAGPQYPADIRWPANVERIEHLPPTDHRCFYAAQRFTLNVTRADMVRAGWSPSIRLFEAAACGVPIISDWWEGLDHFFEPGREILIARASEDVTRFLTRMSEAERRAISERARQRVLARHTAAHRAAELEAAIEEARQSRKAA